MFLSLSAHVVKYRGQLSGARDRRPKAEAFPQHLELPARLPSLQ